MTKTASVTSFDCPSLRTHCNIRAATCVGGVFLLIVFSALATAIAYADFPIPLGAKIAVGGACLTLAALSTRIAKVCAAFLPFTSNKTEDSLKQLIPLLHKNQEKQQELLGLLTQQQKKD